MSVKKKSNDNLKRVGTYAFSALCGAVASAALLMLFAVMMYVLGMPPETAGAMSFVSFAAGCMLCGFVCGSIKQRGGLRIGATCALIMLATAFAVSALSGGLSGSFAVAKIIAALLGACSGAVLGVNRKRA